MHLPGPHQLYAYTGGKRFDAAKPTIVFLHGAQHDHSVWILQSRYMAHHGYSVLALDLPGHMRSAGPALESVEAIAERVTEGLRDAGVTNVLIVGHSMGSLIALEVARRMPEAVRGVALIATAFPMRVADQLLQATSAEPAQAMDMINVWSHSGSVEAFDRKPSNPGPGFSTIWQNLRLMQRIERINGPDVLPKDFAACNRYAAGVDAIGGLTCPVLFVLGSADAMTLARNAKALIDACHDAQVVTLPGAGHSSMAEAPDAVRAALAAFAHRVFDKATA